MGVAMETNDADAQERKYSSASPTSCEQHVLQLCEKLPSSPTKDNKDMVDGSILLPARFRQFQKKIETDNCNSVIKTDVNDNGCISADDKSIPWQQREKELSLALKWIKQEITSIREQDRELARQFLSLRSSIRHMAVSPHPTKTLVGSASSSAEDLGCYGSSTLSLDDGLDREVELGAGRPQGSALSGDEYSGDFRPRTQSMLEQRVMSGYTPVRTFSPKLTVRNIQRTLSKEYF